MLNSPAARVPHWLDDSNWEWRSTDRTEAQQELRHLIAEWQRSGPNLLKLFKKNPELQASCSEGTTQLIPNRDGVAQLAWFPHPVGSKKASQKDVALTCFIRFLVNPLAPTLGGPCERCGDFLYQEHQTPEEILLASVWHRRYGTTCHAEEETGRLFQKAHDRGTSDSPVEQERFSTDVLEEMGKGSYGERDHRAVADASSQFGKTGCPRCRATRAVLISICCRRLTLSPNSP